MFCQIIVAYVLCMLLDTVLSGRKKSPFIFNFMHILLGLLDNFSWFFSRVKIHILSQFQFVCHISLLVIFHSTLIQDVHILKPPP